MKTKRDICELIQHVDPELGQCGRDYDVYLDRTNDAWVVDYHKDGHHLKTFLDNHDADECMNSDKCIPLGLQIGQLRYNFDKYIHEHSLEM